MADTGARVPMKAGGRTRRHGSLIRLCSREVLPSPVRQLAHRQASLSNHECDMNSLRYLLKNQFMKGRSSLVSCARSSEP